MAQAVAGVTPSAGSADELPAVFHDLTDVLACPESGLPLKVDGAWLVAENGTRFGSTGGIPGLFVPTAPAAGHVDVTEVVRRFYEENPFPGYDGIDSRESLRAKAGSGPLAALLDAQLPKGAIVFDAGCGTGQLTNFLGMAPYRKVIGGDMCLNSLRRAKAFRDRFAIRNNAFVQMNLFRPPLRDSSCDLIVSNGVLHHTGDPQGGLAALVKKLKAGGIVIIGLYNSYARLPTLWRRRLSERFGAPLDLLRPPHEARYSMDDVLTWFAAHRIEFLSGIPHPDGSPFQGNESLFAPRSPGSALARLSTQLGMLLAGGADGGLFIMIGRKKA